MSNPIPEYGLGRRPADDERDRMFRLAEALPAQEPDMTRARYWWAQGWWGNQGPTPHCVGYAWTHWLEDGPETHPETKTTPLIHPDKIYINAQLIDEWPGEDYDGTSVRAGAKYLQQLGYIKEYRWAWNVSDLIAAVLQVGPVVVGTNWYRGMFFPNEKGFITPSGTLAGGHAYVINGCNPMREFFRIKNSWGRQWSRNGYAYISFGDMERLIGEDGEVCLAVEKRI